MDSPARRVRQKEKDEKRKIGKLAYMIRYANVDGQKREPAPGLKGLCPGCGKPVTAKCGSIKIHHWAHLSNKECDNWWEPMTLWHQNWQNYFPEAWREKVLRDDQTSEFHRADIHTPNGVTIEFQHSALSVKELASRENFYKKLIWVLNAQGFKDNIRLTAAIPNPHSLTMAPFNFWVSADGQASSPRYYVKDDFQYGPIVYSRGLTDIQMKAIEDCQKSSPEIYWLFTWKNKHSAWLNCNAPVFLDFGDEFLYWIRKRQQLGTALFYLQIVKKEDFLTKYTKDQSS